MVACPALMISAPASGQGKTTVTAAIAAFHRSQGRRVRVFKTGPDFLDPTILERASGHPVYQLDLWMGGEAHCTELLYKAAVDADLILIEGVMGLFDGNPCSADLAALFGIPVLAVIDAGAMAQTFAAVACGLSQLDPTVPFYGVVANRVGSARHAQMLTERLPATMRFCGALPRDAEICLPERHLGLLQATELPDIEQRITRAGKIWSEHGDTSLPPAVEFSAPVSFSSTSGGRGRGEGGVTSSARELVGVTIAVAMDAAFSFLYRANLDLLRNLGAELCFFSPLADSRLPQADSLYLPGGYPELYLSKLAANTAMLDDIRAHHAANKPILAECGGMLYALQSLTDVQGQSARLLGLMEGAAVMHPRLSALALQSDVIPCARGVCPNSGSTSEAVYQRLRLTASYIHFYFPSDPAAVTRLFLP